LDQREEVEGNKVIEGVFMMKRSRIILTIIIFLSFSNAALAEEYGFFEGMNSKITRGAINAVTGWLEIPMEIVRKCDSWENKPLGVLAGVFSGISRSAGRTVSGCMDLLTFWAADPDDNLDVGIHMNNEYAWEAADEPYDMFEPNFAEGAIIPVTNKFKRGAANFFAGITEIPGQIKKGAQEGNTGLGVAKGFWYWLSREAWGLRDISTAFLPTPSENVGAPFDEAWPWEAWSEATQ
jgi:putative exosortase-associated protein (TIGR04073 family)